MNTEQTSKGKQGSTRAPPNHEEYYSPMWRHPMGEVPHERKYVNLRNITGGLGYAERQRWIKGAGAIVKQM